MLFLFVWKILFTFVANLLTKIHFFMKKRLLAALCLAASLALPAVAQSTSWTADNGNGTFTNPLFYDEFSDPDIIRVGDDYYLDREFMLMSMRTHTYIGKSPTTGSPYSMDFKGSDPARRCGAVFRWEEVEQ